VAESLPVEDFKRMAMRAPDYIGYKEYIDSVRELFDGLHHGLYSWHEQVFRDDWMKVVGRPAMTFEEWLRTSPKAELLNSTNQS